MYNEEAAQKVLNNRESIRKLAKASGMCHVSLYRFVKFPQNNIQPKVGYSPHNRILQLNRSYNKQNKKKNCRFIFWSYNKRFT